MTLTLYLLRHGQSPASRDNVFSGSTDPDLTPDGYDMAQEFAAAYRSVAWQAILSSPLRRAVHTADPVSNASGVTVTVRPELAEIDYGDWDGKTVEVVNRDYHDAYTRWLADPAWNAPTRGETAVAVASRVLRLVEEISRGYPDGNVLLVSHKATIRILICALLGVDVGRYRYRLGCPVASLSVVEMAAHGPMLHRLADRAHLSERLRNLPGT